MHKFSITLPKNWTEVYAKMVAECKEHGITFKGSKLAGSVSFRKYSGEYSVTGSTIQINVTSKPAYVTNRMVESHIKKYIREKEFST